MRIDKLLSSQKYGSRSQLKQDIKNGKVKVNDQIINHSDMKIDPLNDIILYDEQKVFYQEYVYLMLNKPAGLVSATSDNYHQVVVSLIKEPFSRFDLKIAGRLDLDVSGLLVLSNDGQFIHDVTNPKKDIDKEYEVILDRLITPQDINDLLNGVNIKDGNNQIYTAKALNIKVKEDLVYLTISEGKFHQVKRMFKALNLEVVKLKRIRIGKLVLGDLAIGDYQEISKSDIL